MADLKARLSRLEAAGLAAKVPEPVPVLLGELGETRVAIRERHGAKLHDKVVCVLVTDASPDRRTD